MSIKEFPFWAKVAIVILLFVFVLNWPSSSSDWASWVQATGSILALAIAILVSRAQAAITQEIHKNEASARAKTEAQTVNDRAAQRRSWCDAVIAIVEGTAEQIWKIENALKGPHIDENDPFIDVRLVFERSNFVASISALRSLPLPDLRSYDAVQGVMGLANEASLILDYIDRIGRSSYLARPIEG